MIRFGPIEHYRPLMLAALRALGEFMERVSRGWWVKQACPELL